MLSRECKAYIDILYFDKMSISFQLVNKSGKTYMYDKAFGIQMLNKDKWVEVSTISGQYLVINTVGYILDKDSKSDVVKINWESTYGRLSDGIYRLTKALREINNTYKCVVYAEFCLIS